VDPTLSMIDVESMRGIEIGPLRSPRIPKALGPVRYLDHTDTAHLREKYADNGPMRDRLDEIVDVDYALNGRSISETVRDDAPFDYVVASHVIEHIPDPVGWMIDISSILRLGGILSLVIPDKRYSFDVNRTLTGVGDLVDAYLAGRTQPTYRDIYNFHSQIATMEGYVDTAGLWAGTANYENVVRSDVSDPDAEAFRIATYAARSEDYVDVHCHIFTPTSFRAIVEVLSRLGLVDFDVVFELPTQPNTLEFFVSLEKVRSTAQSRSDVSVDLHLSDRERSMIRLKRRVLRTIRSGWRHADLRASLGNHR
jgi:predicted SAM-dependent methyltransferase